MISRFFTNIHFRRVLCCLLALVTLGCCLSPAFVQPAEAIAVADDVLIASLGLLALSWAGITFNTMAGANSGVSRLFQSRPAAKLSLAGLLTKKLVVDGTKLLLTSDVRDVFNTVLPDIKSTFPSDAATSPSTDTTFKGGIYKNIPVGVPLITPEEFFTRENAELASKSPSSLGLIYSPDFNNCKAYIDGVPVRLSCRRYAGAWTTYPFNAYRLDDGSRLFDEFNLPSSCLLRSVNGVLCAYYAQDRGDGVKSWFRGCKLPFSSIVIYETPGTASLEYNQSKEVDGTQIQEITWGIQFVPDPNDPTEPTKPGDGSGNKPIPVWPLGPVQAPFDPNISQETANQNPGLSPEEMIAELKKLLEAQQTGGGDSGTTNPNPNPNPDPDPGPDVPGGADVPPDFNQMMTPNLKDFFPFCIPGDIKKMIDALCAAPEAPKFTFATSFMGQVYSVNIDLSAWNGVATSVRYMVVAAYIAALAVATRKFIKW